MPFDPGGGIPFWATFPGIQQVERASFTLTHGISPSVAMLEIEPQDASQIPLDGTLRFFFGDLAIEFPDCRINRASFDYDTSGMVWRLSLCDRRWKWAFDRVNGSYNERHSGIGNFPQIAATRSFGSIDASTIKTPYELASLLLDAMGETGYDINGIPTDQRPEVFWENDNPAQMLQQLCDQLGCSIVLTLDNIVRVVRNGIGAELPKTDVERISHVVQPPKKPDTIVVVGARSRYQVDLPLEAVGLDIDGTIVPIDLLSYAPANDPFWREIDSVNFWNVDGWELIRPDIPANLIRAQSLGWINPRELARQSVYKWYRINMQDIGAAEEGEEVGTPIIPGWQGGADPDQWGSRIKHLWQILPLNDDQNEGWYDPQRADAFTRFPAWVFGTFFNGGVHLQKNVPLNTPPGSFCYQDFSIDRERGIVQFSELCYRVEEYDDLDNLLDDDVGIYPARLFLRVAVNVRAEDTRVWDHWIHERDVPGEKSGTGPQIIKRDEIERWVIPAYSVITHRVESLTTSDQFAEAESNYAVDAALLEILQTQQPEDVTYMGLVPIELDGAVKMVSFQIGPQGAMTRASRQTEWDPAVIQYRERRMLEHMRVMPALVQRLQDQERRR